MQWHVEQLPEELRKNIGICTWQQVTVGESGAYTFRLTSADGNRYLKIVPQNLQLGLEREVAVLQWLEGKLPVPQVLCYCYDSGYQYLLMTEIQGTPSYDSVFAADLPQLVRLLAKGLRMIHSIDIKDCPFDQSLSVKIKTASYRTAQGLVREDDFDAVRQGRKAQDLLEELLALRPTAEDLVFTHGDYCLPNVLIKDGDISGFIDWSRGGIADRYQDLALAARSLTRNFDAKFVPLLFAEYGLTQIDYAKIEYYQLLDEFF